MADKFANTPTKRFLKLTGMGAKVAGKYAKTRLTSSFSSDEKKQQAYSAMYGEMGQQVLQTLGEMKGAAMKAGQIASQMKHFFPPEFADEIAKLQQHSQPMAYELIASQIQAELGFRPEKLFKSFEKKPFAAASIGQVHKAVMHDGRTVVIKVQYPGVYDSCRSDLIQLKRLFSLSGLLKVDKQALDEVFSEIETKLLEELDYQTEAENLREFRAFHAGFPEIVIPEVIDQFTSERVLSLSYEPGDGIDELNRKGYSTEMKNRLAVTLVEAMLREVLEHQRVHADPHPGNFAFRPDGSVIIYDYGCVADMQDVVIDHYIDMAEACLNGQFERIDRMMLELGVRNPEEAAVAPEQYRAWYEDLVLPALEEDNAGRAITRIQAGVKKHMESFMAMRGVFQPCAATIYLNRVIGGHFLNLAQMDVNVDLKPVFRRHVFGE